MNCLPTPTSAVPGACPKSRPSTGRQPTLAEIVRDLAGWTPPARPVPTTRPLTNWPLV